MPDRKEYFKRYNAERYKDDPAYRDRIYKANKANRDTVRDWLKVYKATVSCCECGEKHPACLDFHHTDPTIKERAIGQRSSWSLKRLKAEIAKCIVLCANCHRKLHYI